MSVLKQLIFLGSITILFSYCKQESALENLDGTYTGQYIYEYERIDIQNFDTEPDTTYSEGLDTFLAALVIENGKYEGGFTEGAIQLIGTDSLHFIEEKDHCPPTADCAYFYANQKYVYQFINDSLFLQINDGLWYERQYNTTDKDLWKTRVEIELVRE